MEKRKNSVGAVFGNNLLYYLSEKNIKQKDLAAYLNKSEQAVSSWMLSGVIPRPDLIDKIAIYLDINVSMLFEQNGNEDIIKIKRALDKMNEDELKMALDVLRAIFNKYFEEDNKNEMGV